MMELAAYGGASVDSAMFEGTDPALIFKLLVINPAFRKFLLEFFHLNM